MSDRDAPPLDEKRIVEALDRQGVDHVVVGGIGARLHGATRGTRDFDVCPAWQPDNLDRLAAALRGLDAKLKGLPAGVTLPPIDAQMLARMELSTWRTSAGDLDVVLGIPADKGWNLNRFVPLAMARQ